MMHEQVVRFACSLDEKRVVLSRIFETIYTNPGVTSNASLLESICNEQAAITGINPLMSIYIDYTICTQSPAFIARSMDVKMTKYDIGHLCEAAHAGDLNSLTSLDLSGNTLTNSLANLVLGDNCPKFRSLETIDLSNTGLGATDVKRLFTALHDGKFPNLKNLRFLPAPLTDCLSVMLQGANHPAFPFKWHLMLQKSCLSRNDIQSIGKALREGKLPDLREINLSGNMLTDRITELLDKIDHSTFEALETIDLSNTELSTTDVKCLFTALHYGKFPKLKSFQFLPAPLTDCLSVMLQGANHPAFPFKWHLMLQKSCLSRNDIRSLGKALREGKLPDLREINLSGNMLTDCITELLDKTDHSTFEALETIDLSDTELSTTDVKCLFTALHNGKFPNLKNLRFLPAPLTGCLSVVLEAADHPAFPFKWHLMLQKSCLNRNDIRSVGKALRKGKLRDLTGIDLSDNMLTDYITDLLGEADEFRFATLKMLNISNCQLGPADVKCLFKALHSRRFPSLREFSFLPATMTDCLAHILSCELTRTSTSTCSNFRFNEYYPFSNVLPLQNAALSRNDMKSLFSDISLRRFSDVKAIDLSGNTLTNGFKEALQSTTLVHYAYLEILKMERTELSADDITAICSVIRRGAFPRLKSFLLKDIFAAAKSQELSRLKTLQLNGMKLVKQDLSAIHEGVASNRLPNLKLLNLSDTILSDYVGSIFGHPDIARFQSLHVLQITNTRLRETDLDILSQALLEGKIPALEELHISNNTLSKNLGKLLDGINHCLTLLDLEDTHLAATDVKSLCSAIREKKFLKLSMVSLCHNILTNHIGEMLCASDEVELPNLVELWLIRTGLNGTDVAGLSQAVKSARLPKLKHLHLDRNNLQRKQELLDLMEVSKAQINIGHLTRRVLGQEEYYQYRWCTRFPKRKLQLYLDVNDYPSEFFAMLKTADSYGSIVLINNTEFERIV